MATICLLRAFLLLGLLGVKLSAERSDIAAGCSKGERARMQAGPVARMQAGPVARMQAGPVATEECFFFR